MEAGDVILIDEDEEIRRLGWIISCQYGYMQLLSFASINKEDLYYIEKYKVCNRGKITVVKHIDDIDKALQILRLESDKILSRYKEDT